MVNVFDNGIEIWRCYFMNTFQMSGIRMHNVYHTIYNSTNDAHISDIIIS